MKTVLLSIQPKWCELIASGKKTVEIRKTAPKIKTPFKCYIYCTKQKVNGEILLTYDKKVKGRNKGFRESGDIPLAGKVIGKFVCDKIDWHGHSVYVIREECIKALEGSCLTEKEFHNYMNYPPTNPYQDLKEARKKYEFYGWHISDLVIYDKPKELSEFRKICKYRNDDGSCQFDKVDCDCVKFDFNPDYSVNFAECCNYMCRPPQSWCYVEKLEG